MIRPARHQNLGGDIPWIATALVVAGGVVAIVARAAVDVLVHRHRAA